jgi:hypothetical protein
MPRNSRNIENVIYLDDDFEDLIVIPAKMFGELKSGPLLHDGSLIFQVCMIN